MRVINKLDPNVYSGPVYTTNVHTHGLHISGWVDDITATIGPGEQHTYPYALPADHAAGLHWYHSHDDGKTVLQVGGGLAGLLIVDDAADGTEIPPEVMAMPEVPLLVFDMCPDTVMLSAASAGDAHYSYNGTAECHYLVNGYVDPILEVNAGEWNRVRMLSTTIRQKGSIVQFVGGDCDVLIAGRDGVYYEGGPREKNNMYFNQATRAEFLVRCRTDAEVQIAGTTRLLQIRTVGTDDGTSLSPVRGGCNCNSSHSFARFPRQAIIF